MAHHKVIEMRNTIRDIKKQEGTLKEEAVTTEQKVEKIMRDSE